MMERSRFFVFSLALYGLLQSSSVASEEPYKVVCYLGSWANYRHGSGKFLIEDIDASLCTHLIYGFAKLGSDNRIAAYDPYLDLKENWGLGAFNRLNSLKKENPRVNTLIAIGGWNEGSEKYSRMASSSATRKIFVDSCLEFVLHHGFDGLDMDWEYPANRGGSPEDKQNFVFLLKELKGAFQPYGLILSAAVSAGADTIRKAYDLPSIAHHLDFINLMTYDFHGSWETVTGHNTPLYPRKDEQNAMLTVDYAVRLWISSGVPPEKLILGMAFYGRSFALQDVKKTSIGSPVTGAGQAGPYTGESGYLGFNEICMLRRDKGWTVVIDEDYKAPYMFKDRQWIGFDDIESIAAKVEYLKKMKLGGAMVWSLDTDDFRGECELFRYPLLTTIRRGLESSIPNQLSKTVAIATTPSSSPVRTSVPNRPITEQLLSVDDLVTESTSVCTKKGYFRDPKNCKKFYLCTPSFYGGFDIYWYTCALGTVFSETQQSCSFPVDVPECKEK